jgi:hypothetical protein
MFGLPVTVYNAPGLLMAMLWFIAGIVTIFFYHDLPVTIVGGNQLWKINKFFFHFSLFPNQWQTYYLFLYLRKRLQELFTSAHNLCLWYVMCFFISLTIH